jgi:hypothetical protein
MEIMHKIHFDFAVFAHFAHDLKFEFQTLVYEAIVKFIESYIPSRNVVSKYQTIMK